MQRRLKCMGTKRGPAHDCRLDWAWATKGQFVNLVMSVFQYLAYYCIDVYIYISIFFIYIYISGWWFQTFFIFHNIWDNPSHWLILSCPGWLQKGLLPIFKNTKKIRNKYNPKIQNQNCRVWKIQLVGFVCFLYFGSWFPKVNTGLALWLIFESVFSLYFVFLKFWVRIFFVFCIFEIVDSYFFSRMRSKGSRFTLGVWGWGCVRSTLRSRAQPSATVRNRSREDRMAVPMGSFTEVVLFGGFRRLVASFRVAGVALRDIQTCSATCRKSFCVAGAILLRRLQKMCCSFRGRRSTLDVSIVIFRGRRSTLDVSCCVFFANRIGRAASSGDKVQIPWQSWHLVRCAENWQKPRTKYRFWGCKFSGSKENS